MYLDDFDYDSMDPDELSKFFPSRWEMCVCVCVCVGGGVCVRAGFHTEVRAPWDFPSPAKIPPP